MFGQGQPNGGESCIMLESGLTHSYVAKLPQHFIACSMQILCCRRRKLQTWLRMGVCETLMPNVVAPEAHQNDHGYVCELSGHTFESLLKLDACTGMGICPGQYSMWVKSTHTKKISSSDFAETW